MVGAAGQTIAEGILHKIKVKAMEGFGALTLRCFVAGTFFADGDSKGPSVGLNCRGKDMIIPCLAKGSNN
jgi:hypothetical protein